METKLMDESSIATRLFLPYSLGTFSNSPFSKDLHQLSNLGNGHIQNFQ